MNFLSVRNRLASLLLCAALVAPAMAQTVLALPAAQAPGSDVRQALTVPPGGTLRLERLKLDEASGEVASADLRRTNVGSAPLLVVHSGTKVTTTRPAPRAHFTGQLVGDPKSSVFVSIDEQGALRSIVRRGEEVFVSDMPAPGTAGNASTTPGTASLPALRARRVERTADAPSKPFACGVNDEFIERNYAPPSAALLENLRKNHQRAGLLGAASRGAEALGTQRRADIIIETDYELFQRLGSSSAVNAYVTDLMGYVSSQYESEIGSRLNVTQINVYSSSADPWTGSSTNVLLDELQAYWNASSRFSQPRHHVHLLSARNAGGGIAYINTLPGDAKDYAYGVSAEIDGGFSASSPQIVWDAVVVAHEIGHAFGSSHTHSFDNPYVGSNEGGAIDCCYSESRGTQCTNLLGGINRPGRLPGINSISGGIASTGAGTIMSYCDQINGGLTDLSFNFGTNHTRGVNPWRVASVLQSSAQTYLPLDNVVQNYTLSVSRQGTGSGTVTSSPVGISCGSTCSASYAAGTSVTLSAQPASGSTFSGWSGACTGTSSCTVSMDSARSVTASFTAAATTRLVTLTKSGTGTGSVTSSPAGLSCGSTCSSASASFASTSAITLTAQAASGSTFVGWSGACSGTSSSCTIAAGTSSANVTASFNTSTGGGTITPLAQTNLSGASGSFQYFSVAVPAGATNLSIQTSGGTGDVDLYVRFGQSPTRSAYDCLSDNYGNTEICTASNPTAGTYYIMLEGYVAFSGLTLTASYQTGATQNYSLTVARQGTGSGTVTSSPAGISCGSTCSASYAAGTSVTLSAQPASGSTFAGWGGACSGTSSCTVSMSAARSVTASFTASSGGGPLADPVVFVTQQYRDFLGRSPESTALNYWVNQLNAGTATRAQVIQTLMNSTEFQGRFGPLVRLYTAYFRRVPDYGGLMYWFNAMYPSSGGGTSLAQVSQAFAQSQEFIGTYGALDNAGFVNLVYQNVLGRTAEPAGFTYWLGELNRGMSRGQMMIGFSESAENQANTANSQGITLAHVGMLKRSPNTSEHDRWLADMNAGRANLLSLINSLLQSSEYAARF
ncbi:MAG: DUF4214 domain-containing protein [Simplicispira sp.]|uniref:DUF4214 domain-containing protein n=1 Tax=Simplicispira sp. TaxID=2015802 RepID=UPI0025838BC8|nr:DUF4214 domain-containing protein [Simplicispira sp.]MDD2691487.1 DUF4214 domain-containing protein [Simplicispira sp.]